MPNPYQQARLPPPPLYSALQDFNTAAAFQQQQQQMLSPTSIYPDPQSVQRFMTAQQPHPQLMPLRQMVRNAQPNQMPTLLPATAIPSQLRQRPPHNQVQPNQVQSNHQQQVHHRQQAPATISLLSSSLEIPASSSMSNEQTALSKNQRASENTEDEVTFISDTGPITFSCKSEPALSASPSASGSSHNEIQVPTADLVPLSPSIVER